MESQVTAQFKQFPTSSLVLLKKWILKRIFLYFILSQSHAEKNANPHIDQDSSSKYT